MTKRQQLACGYTLKHSAPFGAHLTTHMEHGTYFVRLYYLGDSRYVHQWSTRDYSEVSKLRRVAREGFVKRVTELAASFAPRAQS